MALDFSLARVSPNIAGQGIDALTAGREAGRDRARERIMTGYQDDPQAAIEQLMPIDTRLALGLQEQQRGDKDRVLQGEQHDREAVRQGSQAIANVLTGVRLHTPDINQRRSVLIHTVEQMQGMFAPEQYAQIRQLADTIDLSDEGITGVQDALLGAVSPTVMEGVGVIDPRSGDVLQPIPHFDSSGNAVTFNGRNIFGRGQPAPSYALGHAPGPGVGGPTTSTTGDPVPAPPAPPGSTAGLDPESLDMLARLSIGEAPRGGRQAVINVVLNRARQSGMSVAEVIQADHQFEPFGNRRTWARLSAIPTNSPEYQDALRAIQAAQASDPTNGATHFYSPTAQTALGRQAPDWASGREGVDIGGNVFYNIGYTGPGGGRSSGRANATPAAETTPDGGGPVDLGNGWVMQRAPPEWRDTGSGHEQRNTRTNELRGSPTPPPPEDDSPLGEDAVNVIAEQYLAGQPLPPFGMGRSGGQNRNRVMNRVAALTRESGLTGADLTEHFASTAANRSALAAVVRQRTMVGNFEQTALRNAALVEQTAIRGGANGGSPVLNRWIQHGRTAYAGDPDVAAFDTAIGTFITEYARVMSGGTGNQQLTDSARAHAEGMLNNTMTPAQLRATLGVMRQEMHNRMISLDEERDRLRGELNGRGGQQQPASERLNIPQAALTEFERRRAAGQINPNARRGDRSNPHIARSQEVLDGMDRNPDVRGDFVIGPDGALYQAGPH